MNALTIRAFVIYFLTNTCAFRDVDTKGWAWLADLANHRVNFWTSFVSIALMAPVGILGPFIAVYAESWDMRRLFW